MPGEGTATIEYKVQSRRVDESNPDGPRYGADIEIRSIDPIAGADDGDGADGEDAADEEDDAGDDGDSTDMGSTIFLRQFGSAGFQRMRRVEGALAKKLKKAGAGTGAHNRAMRSAVWPKQEEKFVGSVQRAMKRPDFGLLQTPKLRQAAKQLGSTLFLHQFAGERDRDPEGRFDRGDVAKPDDFAAAGMAGKKKLAMGAGLGVAAGGAALASPKVRKAGKAALAAMMLRRSAMR